MEDKEIIGLYFARNELAIVETDRKYGSYCRSIALSVLHNEQDSEETLSDTLMQAWNVIPPQRPQVLKMFLAKITRNLAFSRWRKQTAEKRGGGAVEQVLDELAWCVPAPGSVEDGINARELAKSIRNFLDTIPPREQDIFLRRYFFLEESEVIAARYGMKRDNVLRILSRTRQKLKFFLTQEGYIV